MKNFPKTLIERLAELALRLFFQKDNKGQKDRMRPLLGVAIRQGLQLMAEDEATKAVAELEAVADKRNPRSPPVVMQMLRIVGTAGAIDWVREHDPQLWRHLGTNGLGHKIVAWLAAQPPDVQERLFEAGLRRSTGGANPNDQELFLNSLGRMLSGKEAKMAHPRFIFDVSRLPQSLRPQTEQDKFKTAVIAQLANFPAPTDPKAKENVEAAVIGMLLLDEQFNFTTTTFPESVRRAWEETLDKHKDFNGNDVTNVTVYNEVANFIVADRVVGSATTVDIFYQEFAFASRHAIQNVLNNPPPGESFKTQVKIGLERYVAGPPSNRSNCRL